MSTADVEYLKIHFYDPLVAKLKGNNDLKEKSIIISLFLKRSNSRYDYLKELSQSGESENQDIIDILIKRKFLRVTDEHNRYQITAYGVWAIESEFIRIDELVKVFDDKYFDVFSKNRPLKPQERVVLLSLIAARTFSERCPLNKDNGDKVLDRWLEIFKKSEIFLLDNAIISKKAGLDDKQHVEKAVSYIISHTNDLTKKTRNIYKSSPNVAYLDLYDYERAELDVDKLSYLFWKVFERELETDFQRKIFAFCASINSEYKPVLFNASEHTAHIFSKLEYDDILTEALFRADINRKSFEIRESV